MIQIRKDRPKFDRLDIQI